MYQYPGRQQQQMPPTPQQQHYVYNRTLLTILWVICVVSIVSILVAASQGDTSQTNIITILEQIGYFLVYPAMILTMILDWRGTMTLRGTGKSNGWYILLYILFPFIMFPIYLIRVSMDFNRQKKAQEQQRQREIATLEAQLGILPPTEGQCRVCHKPLIVGAEFCQYCGASAIERPKICPVCATTALPDAKFCPKCRAALP